MQTTAKNKKASRLQQRIFFGAIIITLLIHGLLLVLFDYTPSKKTYSNSRTAGITFMNLANQSPPKRAELLSWLEYHEPSLISAPNVKHGYNQLTPHVNFRKAHPDKIYQVVLPKSPKNSLKNFSTLGMHKTPINNLSENFIFKHPGHMTSGKIVKASLPEVKYPLIKNNNTILKLSFSSYLLKDSEKLKAKSMSIHYNLEQSKMLPRVVVVDSSGNRDFDMLLLRELSLRMDDISQSSKDFTISIQWRKEALK
jgi:hypothetical protein